MKLIAIAAAFIAAPAYAETVTFTYTDEVTNLTVTNREFLMVDDDSQRLTDALNGVVLGDLITYELVFDNGGLQTANQTFTATDFVSARFFSGSFGEVLPSFASVPVITDASGQADLSGVGAFNAATETIAGLNSEGFLEILFDEVFTLPNGNNTTETIIITANTGNPSITVSSNLPVTAQVSAVPLPAGLPMLAGALGLFGLIRRKA